MRWLLTWPRPGRVPIGRAAWQVGSRPPEIRDPCLHPRIRTATLTANERRNFPKPPPHRGKALSGVRGSCGGAQEALLAGFSLRLSEGGVKLVCRTLQTGPDILYGHITCRCTRPRAGCAGAAVPTDGLPCATVFLASVGPIASAPRLPARESYCLNNLVRSEAEIRSRTRTTRGRKCGNLCAFVPGAAPKNNGLSG